MRTLLQSRPDKKAVSPLESACPARDSNESQDGSPSKTTAGPGTFDQRGEGHGTSDPYGEGEGEESTAGALRASV